MEKWKPQDVIAIITIIGCLVLKYFGMDGTVSAIMIAIVGFYFGLKATEPFTKTTTATQ
jgi:hypothetical protein